MDQTSVEKPTLEKLEALSQRVELLEKLLDEKFMEEKKAQENAECRMQNECVCFGPALSLNGFFFAKTS